MEKQPENRELLEVVDNTMMQFNDAMRRREELSVRTGRRASQIIRVGAMGYNVNRMAAPARMTPFP